MAVSVKLREEVSQVILQLIILGVERGRDCKNLQYNNNTNRNGSRDENPLCSSSEFLCLILHTRTGIILLETDL